MKFFEEFLNRKSPSGFWNEGEGEDEFKDKEAGLGGAGVVKDVFKPSKKQFPILFSKTRWTSSRFLAVQNCLKTILPTRKGLEAEVTDSRFTGFFVKIKSQVEKSIDKH